MPGINSTIIVCVNQKQTLKLKLKLAYAGYPLSRYHADTPITIKAEANPQGLQPLSLIFMSTLYNVS